MTTTNTEYCNTMQKLKENVIQDALVTEMGKKKSFCTLTDFTKHIDEL